MREQFLVAAGQVTLAHGPGGGARVMKYELYIVRAPDTEA